MNFGSIFEKLFKEVGKGGQEQTQAAGSGPMYDALARQFFDANQGGATDGSGVLDMARMWGSSRAQPAPAPAEKPASGGVSPSTMQLITPPQAGAFNITAPKGTDPKKYQPAQMAMTVPGPSALTALGLLPQTSSPFQLTLPKGTDPKKYQPAQLAMTPPSPVGLENMMQVLNLFGTNSPFGRG